MPRKDLIRLRAGTTAQWDAADAASVTDPTRLLAANEQGYDTTAKVYKIGDGVTKFANLPGFLDETGLSASIADITTDAGGDVVEFNDTRYFRKTGALANLPAVSYWAHRGGGGAGGGYAPEESLEGFRVSAACGVDGLEMDVNVLGDGGLGLMHDDTVDRTTDGTGTVASFSTPAFLALNAADYLPWPRATPPALLTDTLNEFGGKVPLMIEAKASNSVAGIIAACNARGLAGSVIIETDTLGDIPTIRAAGYDAYFYWGGTLTSPTVSAVVAAGATHLGCDASTMSDADITTLVATGKPVIPYNATRRFDRDRLTPLGVAGFISDQPVYMRATTAQRTVDSWRQGVYGHGLINLVNDNMPTIESGALTLTGNALAQYLMVGEVSPVASPSAFTLDIDLGWKTLPADTSKAVAVAITTDDSGHAFAGTDNGNGYQFFLRASGVFVVFKVVKGVAATSLGTFNVGALSAGTLAHLKVIVDAANVSACITSNALATVSGTVATGTVTSIPVNSLAAAIGSGTKLRLPNGQIVTLSSTAAIGATALPVNSFTLTTGLAAGNTLSQILVLADTTYRGGYVHVGKTSTDTARAQFKNLTIT